MDDLIDILESFNRKERFFLIAQALGQKRDNKPAFTLSDNFRRELEQKLGFDFEIPADAFVAMDYHLDWVAASLVKWKSVKAGKADKSTFLNPGQEVVEGNQEDIDLLVAFDCGGQYHLILIEAKAYQGKGYAGFDRSQLKSKSDRLDKIFDKAGQKYPGVTLYFCLMSQNKPTSQTPYEWPWDEAPWIPASLPDKNTRRIVERYNAETGKADKDGDHFRIRSL